MIPSKKNISLWLIITSMSVIPCFFQTVVPFWKYGLAFVVGVVILDALLTLRRPLLSVQRGLHHNLPTNSWSKGSVRISSDERFRQFVQVYEHHSSDIRLKGLPQDCAIEPFGYCVLQYKVFPTKRGAYSFKGLDLFVKSPLQLWQRKWFFPCDDAVKVFPNFKEISHFALLATHHHLSQMGIRKLTKRGEGKEFHQLREYRLGDDIQKIDWKATSRFRKLISKEYQDERDQQILFILDCGRRMKHADIKSSQLDQALNSILLLSYVASRQGDSVGLYSFGGTQKWIPPRKQENSVRSLLLNMYDIEASTEAADYYRATQDIMSSQSRRSLMVIITNSRAEDYDDIIHMVRQLKRKHLVVLADIREEVLSESVREPITTFDDALRFQSLQQYLAKRESLQSQLHHLGVFTLDVTAKQLPSSLVNCYLDIKGAGQL